MKYNFIVIEGNIGAGKTSLTKKIAEQFNAKIILEQFADNPFLPKFYKDPEKYSFPLELSFLAERYNQLKKDLSHKDLFKTFTISDYFFMKSLIFARQNLTDDVFNLYRQLFEIIYKSLPKPDIYIYLYLDIDNLLENINKRGRSYEKNISREYLENIQTGYFDFFKQQKNLKILIIDTNNIDFVNNKNHFDLLIENIFNKEYKTGINRIIL